MQDSCPGTCGCANEATATPATVNGKKGWKAGASAFRTHALAMLGDSRLPAWDLAHGTSLATQSPPKAAPAEKDTFTTPCVS